MSRQRCFLKSYSVRPTCNEEFAGPSARTPPPATHFQNDCFPLLFSHHSRTGITYTVMTFILCVIDSVVQVFPALLLTVFTLQTPSFSIVIIYLLFIYSFIIIIIIINFFLYKYPWVFLHFPRRGPARGADARAKGARKLDRSQ